MVVTRYPSDHDRLNIPFAINLNYVVFKSFFSHNEHPFLRFGEHDFVSTHANLTNRNKVKINLYAPCSFFFDSPCAHFRGGTCNAGSAHILQADDIAGCDGFKGSFKEKLLGKRISHLNTRTFVFRGFTEIFRSECRSVDAISSGRGAYNKHRITFAKGSCTHCFMMLHDADRHGIDQRIACIALFKINFATDRRDAERVAVISYAAHNTINQIADTGILRRAEPERVE